MERLAVQRHDHPVLADGEIPLIAETADRIAAEAGGESDDSLGLAGMRNHGHRPQLIPSNLRIAVRDLVLTESEGQKRQPDRRNSQSFRAANEQDIACSKLLRRDGGVRL